MHLKNLDIKPFYHTDDECYWRYLGGSMKNNKAGFTLIEMIFCISVILVILLLVIPNVTSKNNVVKGKGCEAQVEVVNSQIILYQIEHDELPTSISQLTSGSNPYLTQKQATCPNGKSIYISNGQAYV